MTTRRSLRHEALMVCLHHWMLPDLGKYIHILETQLPVLQREITQYRLNTVNSSETQLVQTELVDSQYFPIAYINLLKSELESSSPSQLVALAADQTPVTNFSFK